MGACANIGAAVYLGGLLDPAHTLALLAERRRIPGKRERVSVMSTYPSYLGELVETGLRLGYGPGDFGLRRLLVGGELLTQGLRARCQRLFGPVELVSNYGMTELAPFGGNVCSREHLHFDPSGGLVEVLDLETRRPAAAGAAGSIVATPFFPYRETTLLLRYDTEDVVRTLSGPLDCEMRNLPATSNILGKRRLSVRHDGGWTFPREVLEALEAVEAVPLPARFGLWPAADGVGVEVLARSDARAVRGAIGERLELEGVPVRELRVVTDRAGLRQPVPLRGDLRDGSLAHAPGGANGEAPVRRRHAALAPGGAS
jgi:phenylacetate-CoA ligase